MQELELLVTLIREQSGTFSVANRDGEWLVGCEFGQEAEDSPMAAGALYGAGDTFEEAAASAVAPLARQALDFLDGALADDPEWQAARRDEGGQ